MPDLQFNEARHEYLLDGRRLPSVTEILDDVGIIDYSGMPSMVREQVLERGRIVHMCTQYDDELSLAGGSLAASEIDPAIIGYVEAWRRFRRETGFKPDLIEHRGHHPGYGYAGTLDRMGTIRGRITPILLDIKTGKAQPWTRVQLAAYAPFLETPRLFARFSVELRDDGDYSIVCVREGRDWQTDFNVFLSALNVFREKHPNFGMERKAA